MNRKFLLSGFGVLLLLFGGIANAVTIEQFDACVNVDGTISEVGLGCFEGGPTPGSVDDNIGGDGLGTVGVTVTGAGAHYVAMYVDWEIDEATNGFDNEFGATGGAAAAGQSWEIDEPGFVFGDLLYSDPDFFDPGNFLNSTLDNFNGVPASDPEDVSLALGWDFTLDPGETATIEFLLAASAPASGLWLQHADPASDYSFYFSSTLRITDDGTPVPEPGTLWLLGAGLLGLGLMSRRNLTDS